MKHKITITETFICEIEVEANNLEDAMEKGEDYYYTGFASDHMGIPTYREMTIENQHERIEGIEF